MTAWRFSWTELEHRGWAWSYAGLDWVLVSGVPLKASTSINIPATGGMQSSNAHQPEPKPSRDCLITCNAMASRTQEERDTTEKALCLHSGAR